LINYQGRLVDGTSLVNDTVEIVFEIYTNETTGSAVYTETQTVVVADGLFSTMIGASSVPPWQLDNAIMNDEIYLQIDVDGTTMSPRERVVSVAYALMAAGVTNEAITSAMIQDGAIANADISASAGITDGKLAVISSPGKVADSALSSQVSKLGPSIESIEISNGTILFADIGQNGAGLNQVMKWSGGGWAVANDETGSASLASYAENGTFSPAPNASGTDAIAQGAGAVASGVNSVVGGGTGNEVYSSASTIGGGYANLIGHTSTCSTIAGGFGNGIGNVSAYSTIGGGIANTNVAGIPFATIAGGAHNVVAGIGTTVGGGERNRASFFGSTVAGGFDNVAAGETATVGGGETNQATGNRSTVSGGKWNRASNLGSTVAGGLVNAAAGETATVGGGRTNQATGTSSTVGGGVSNRASNLGSTVAGGAGNAAAGETATVGGGETNQATGTSSTVAGGEGNSAGGSYGTIGGGYNNVATDTASTVAGGEENVAGGGWASVPGGTLNAATGVTSFAAGFRAKANHDGAFVWADSSINADFASTGNDQFLIRAAGGVGIGTTSPGLSKLKVAGTVESTSGGFKFPDSSVQTTAASAGVTDHGLLSGLGDDDHTQYHNDARGDVRYYTKTQLNAGQLNSLYYTETELNAGQLDSRYYTEAELNAGQLNNQYYTETELNAGQLDSRYVNRTGDTMSGLLTIANTVADDTLRLTGPDGSYGHGARLNLGDSDHAYIDEDEDDKLYIHARLRTAIMGGSVGIGTTSPSQKLDVDGNARIRSIASGAYSAPVNQTSDGTLTTATSDERMKRNISTIDGALDKVARLRGVTFEWKDRPEMGPRIGLVAQEVEEVVPEAVFTNPTDGYKGILYGELVSVLVEAVKEQRQHNQELTTRLAEMERGMRELQEKMKGI
jgi:hypothetical protein